MKRWVYLAFLAAFFGARVGLAAESPDALAGEYRSALARKDLSALMTLVAFSADTQKHRASMEARFRSRFGKEVVSARIVPFSTYESEYRASLENGAKPVLEPRAWFVVEFRRDKIGEAMLGTTDVLLVGIRNGSYYFSS